MSVSVHVHYVSVSVLTDRSTTAKAAKMGFAYLHSVHINSVETAYDCNWPWVTQVKLAIVWEVTYSTLVVHPDSSLTASQELSTQEKEDYHSLMAANHDDNTPVNSLWLRAAEC